ncbi:MAG: flagellar biosynthetic protein FliR, partial [Spirochaetia bacterium]|nr:flagellar biosynthetic protein FliR [Spirochaetia bacterium]
MEGFSTGSQYYMLILGRMFGLFFTAPVFSTQMVPYRIRIALSLAMAAILYPVSVNYLGELPEGAIPFALAVFSQITVGIIIGFMIMIVFSSFQIAGEIFSVQMGISFSEVLDPQSQVSVPILGTLKNMIAILVFLGVDFYM